MKADMLKYNLWSFLIILLTTASIMLIAPHYPQQAHGIYLPLKADRPNNPFTANIVGNIHVQISTANPSATVKLKSYAFAKHLATQHHADNLIIEAEGYNPGMQSYIVHAKALQTRPHHDD